MIFLTNREDFSQASGLFDVAGFEAIYETFIDTSFVTLGRTVTLHLEPLVQQDVNTQSQGAAQQYNPFFGRVPVPKTNTKGTGVKITHRDVNYSAHIKIGPLKMGDDMQGMGDLKENEAAITLVIEALPDLKQTRVISIEGRRYSIMETRPFGFSTRKYIIVKLKEINEKDTDTSETAG